MEKRATAISFLILSGCTFLPFLAAAIIMKGILSPLQLGFFGDALPPLLDFRVGLSVLCLFALGRKALFGVFLGLAAYYAIAMEGLPSTSAAIEYTIYTVFFVILAGLHSSNTRVPDRSAIRVTTSMMFGLALLIGVLHTVLLLPESGVSQALLTSSLIGIGHVLGFFAIIIFGLGVLRLEGRYPSRRCTPPAHHIAR